MVPSRFVINDSVHDMSDEYRDRIGWNRRESQRCSLSLRQVAFHQHNNKRLDLSQVLCYRIQTLRNIRCIRIKLFLHCVLVTPFNYFSQCYRPLLIPTWSSRTTLPKTRGPPNAVRVAPRNDPPSLHRPIPTRKKKKKKTMNRSCGCDVIRMSNQQHPNVPNVPQHPPQRPPRRHIVRPRRI